MGTLYYFSIMNAQPPIPEDLVFEYLDQIHSESPLYMEGKCRLVKIVRTHFRKPNGKTGYSQQSVNDAVMEWMENNGCLGAGALTAALLTGIPLSDAHKAAIAASDKKYWNTPEGKAKRSMINRTRRWPQNREKHL